jgi:hypothetical protein
MGRAFSHYRYDLPISVGVGVFFSALIIVAAVAA